MKPEVLNQLRKRPAGEVAELYVRLRDRRNAHRVRETKLQNDMDALAGIIQQKLFDAKVKSFRTAESDHVVYVSTRRTAVVRDKEAFKQFVINTGQFDLLETRAALEACDNFALEHTEVDPKTGEEIKVYPIGVEINEIVKLGVRKA